MLILRSRFLGATGLAAYLLAGCGGGGGGGSDSGLSGTEDVKTFVIPAGQTRTVTGDLTIHASQNIEIDGNLDVPEGVNVALVADGPLIVNGKIEPAPTSHVVKKSVERGGNSSMTICGSDGTTVNTVDPPKGTDLNIALNGGGNLVIKNAYGGDGIPSTQSGVPGGPGGSIEIGTSKANSAATAAGAKSAGTPNNVTGLLFFGGMGGRGYNDPGKVVGQAMTATGSAGGAGGNVNVAATTGMSVDLISGGLGGRGGSGTTTPAPAIAATGTQALNSAVTTGDGGKGGSVSTGSLTNSGGNEPGPGGLPGDSDASAQGGGASGNGGSANVMCGKEGPAGTPGAPWDDKGDRENLICKAGAGGDADNNTANGGNGGSCTVTDLKGNAPSARSFVIVLSCGKGGLGYSGSCGVGGNEKATNGGTGGNIQTKGAKYTQTTQGDGGDGGGGTPNGTGGASGVDQTSGLAVGKKGNDGTPCPTTGAKVSSTLSVPGSNISFTSFDAATQYMSGIAADVGKKIVYGVYLATGAVNTYPCSAAITDDTNALCNSNTVTRGTKARGTGAQIYVSSGASSSILILDEATGTQLGTIAVPTSSGGPGALAFDPGSGRLYAGISQGIDVFDTKNSNKLLGTIAITGAPYTIALNPATNRLYASDLLKNFDVVDTSSMTQVATMVLPDNAYTLAVNPNNGVVFATQYNSSKVVAIDPSSNQIVQTLTVGNSPWGIEVDSQRNRLYVANYNYAQTNQQNGSLTEIDTTTYQTITTVTLGKGPTGVAVDETADKIYVANALDSTVTVLNGN